MKIKTIAKITVSATLLLLLGSACGAWEDPCAWCTKQGGICEFDSSTPPKTKCIIQLPKPTFQLQESPLVNACAQCASLGSTCHLDVRETEASISCVESRPAGLV